MQVLLVSTYELGRQPFGLASPAAWLTEQGHQVTCADLCVQSLSPDAVRRAELIAFYLPMHTATRLAVEAIPKVQKINPDAKLCCFGLYAPLNEAYLRKLGVETILGGEFEEGLARLAGGDAGGSLISLDRLKFRAPDRSGLPPLEKYSKLNLHGHAIVTGYTEASRGCKHMCRHCPVVPVYQGHFRIVQADVVLEDIRRQVASGARHITFGDPDFLNGPKHAMQIVDALHAEHPGLTYDATIKIEHLRKHRELLPRLKETGCILVTSAIESVDDSVLEKLDKGHTRADFVEVVQEFRKAGLALAPTFIPFTPWITAESYRDLLALLLDLDLAENVAPVQLALRLLIPQGSRLLELEEVRAVTSGFDEAALLHRWAHVDPAMDMLAQKALKVAAKKGPRLEIFSRLRALVDDRPMPEDYGLIPRAAIPYMDEPWYC